MSRHASTSRHDLESTLLDETSEPMALPLSFLEDITNGFSEDQEIGRGGFAVVYKGTLANGLTVAVKRLSHCYMHEKEFLREVECLLKVKHTNTVRFLGYCADTQGSVADFYGQVVMADVQHRLLCFEYLPKGSLDEYIQDASSGLEWSKRYKIIEGVCEGLSYLHRKNIIHLDLKPANILLDANMVPKISDFGLSRIFEEDKSRFVATNVGGTLGYLAPEFTSCVITHKFDLYSLGVILIELLTGKKGYQAVDTVLESWSNRLDNSLRDTSFEQIRVCTEVGIECIDPNPEKRPVSIDHIVARLNEAGRSQVIPGSSELLDVQPLVLRFPFEPNKSIRCSLQITNNTHKHVLFQLKNNNMNQLCFVKLPLLGIVPPRSAYTIFVATNKQKNLPEQKYFDLILESSTLGDDSDWLSDGYAWDDIFEYPKIMGHVVHEVTLKAVCTPQGGIIMSEVVNVEIPYVHRYCDTHPTKQWIIMGGDEGRIRIWNYEKQKLVGSFKVSRAKVISIKFIERKKWFVAGTSDGFIHVYSYDKMKRIRNFRYNTKGSYVKSLVVHPTQSYILTVVSRCHEAKLWDWNRGWECLQTFMTEYQDVPMFVFNPMEITIASALGPTIKIWGPDSPEPKYTLSGHSENVTCLEFFTSNYMQYLITGSYYCAKIWDVQKKICVHTLEPFMSAVNFVISSPNLPILITCSRDGTVHLLNSANFRVEKVFQTCITGDVCGISFFIGPRRVIIQQHRAISVMYVDNVGCETGSTYSGEQQLNADILLGNKTFKERNVSAREKSMEVDDLSEVISTSRLLEVHRMSGSLELINNTNECVAFSVIDIWGIVPAKSTYSLIAELPVGAVLRSSISGDKYVSFETLYESSEFFKEAKEMGNAVHELALEAVFSRQGETPFPAIPPITKIIECVQIRCLGGLYALDVHPTDPLILTLYHVSRSGHEIWLWNCDDTERLNKMSIICGQPAYSIKFVAQTARFVAAIHGDFINVYSYGRNIEKITTLKFGCYYDISLAVHSIKSYVSSPSQNKGSLDLIKEITDWKCTQTFEAVQSCRDCLVIFNRKGIKCSAVPSHDYTIEISKLDTPRSQYKLSGHSDTVNCLEFFERDNQEYLISCSDDCTVKIWDLQRKTCVHTLRAFLSPVIFVVSLRDLPYLFFSSRDGIIHIWNSRNSRLERMLNFGGSRYLAPLYLMGTNRVVIHQNGIISFIDIDTKAVE